MIRIRAPEMKQLVNVVAIGLATLFLLVGTAPVSHPVMVVGVARSSSLPAATHPSVESHRTTTTVPTTASRARTSTAERRSVPVAAGQSGRVAEMFGYGLLASMGTAGIVLMALAYRSRRRPRP
jgi:hypothetical protein